jgi:hypothetical protein
MPRCADFATARGYCVSHRQQRDEDRRAGRTLTYSEGWWRRARRAFFAELVQLGITPVCGAVLPGGPQHNLSQCHRDGLLMMTSSHGGALHAHHEPPLTKAEARDKAIVTNPLRLVALCDSCHSTTTRGGKGMFEETSHCLANRQASFHADGQSISGKAGSE